MEAAAHHSQKVSVGGSVTLRARAGHMFALGANDDITSPKITSVDAFFLGGAAEIVRLFLKLFFSLLFLSSV